MLKTVRILHIELETSHGKRLMVGVERLVDGTIRSALETLEYDLNKLLETHLQTHSR